MWKGPSTSSRNRASLQSFPLTSPHSDVCPSLGWLGRKLPTDRPTSACWRRWRSAPGAQRSGPPSSRCWLPLGSVSSLSPPCLSSAAPCLTGLHLQKCSKQLIGI